MSFQTILAVRGGACASDHFLVGSGLAVDSGPEGDSQRNVYSEIFGHFLFNEWC